MGTDHGFRPADRDYSSAGRYAPGAVVDPTDVDARMDGPAVGDAEQMRTYLADAPRWVLGVVAGVPFGAGMGVYTKLSWSMSWPAAIVGGLITGVAFGATMAFSLDKQRREVHAAAGDLPANKLRAGHRAAERGPVPIDPETRAAARRIATRQLELLLRVRKFVIAAMALQLVSSVGMAVTGSPWRLLCALVVGVLLIGQWYWPQRIRRRIALLSEATDETAE